MKVQLQVPSEARWLNRVLALGVELAKDDLQRHPGLPRLYRSGVRYARTDDLGFEYFALPSQVYRKRWADCDQLSVLARAALQLKGIAARAVVVRTGPALWHAVVRMPNGKVIDPSKRLGMRGRG